MKSAINLLVLIDIAKKAKIDKGGKGGDNKIVKKSPLFKKLNIFTEYITFPYSNVDSILSKKR